MTRSVVYISCLGTAVLHPYAIEFVGAEDLIVVRKMIDAGI